MTAKKGRNENEKESQRKNNYKEKKIEDDRYEDDKEKEINTKTTIRARREKISVNDGRNHSRITKNKEYPMIGKEEHEDRHEDIEMNKREDKRKEKNERDGKYASKWMRKMKNVGIYWITWTIVVAVITWLQCKN